jgi:hypothetical protein
MRKEHLRLTATLALLALVATGASVADARVWAKGGTFTARVEGLSGARLASGDPDVPQAGKRLAPSQSPDGADADCPGGGVRWVPRHGRVWTLWFLSRWFANAD